MKRSFNFATISNQITEDEPNSKVVLVEREPSPGGVSLIDPSAIAKKSYLDSMELLSGATNVNTALQCNAKNKLEIIGRQMKHLQELITDVFEETELSLQLHNAACNFVKKPGHIYHLYERPSGQKYFGMLSPLEWTAPHNYLGSFKLEADLSWAPATSNGDKHNGLAFLQMMQSTR